MELTENLMPRINSHVGRLNRYLPFSAAHEQIYEEYQTGEDSLELQTVALDYAIRAIEKKARCIVLTGDAGHGKTHLCRRLIECVLGHDAPTSRKLLKSSCNAAHPIKHVSDHLHVDLRIHKDFSELDPQAAAALLEGSADSSNEVLIVCANEGRLRAVVQSPTAGLVCKQIISLFERSFESGLSSEDGLVHIVNLNYQSVSSLPAAGRTGLLRRALQSWVDDGRRWQSCSSCALVEVCPIRFNRVLLSEGALAAQRVSRLEEMLEAVERLGQVVTIREMLMLVSYLITGGLQCEDINKKVTAKGDRIGWQYSWAFYNLLFSPPPLMAEDRLYKGIPVLSVLKRLDPGSLASRAVDDKLLNVGGVFLEGQLDLQFRLGSKLVDAAHGLDELIGNPQNKAELAREAELSSRAVRALRRKSIFDDLKVENSLMARIGFRYGDDFLRVIAGSLSSPEQVRLKSVIIAGFHSIQGLRMSRSEATLHLVDPAFGRASNDAAIIARRISSAQLQLLPARKAWSIGERSWSICDSVDWIDRTVVVRVVERGGDYVDIGLDLLSFECVTRSASGYVSEDFYAQEIRRIRAFLGRLAALETSVDSQIQLFMDGKVQSVSIDMGVIQVGGL
jgi:hypothetical protein